MRRRWMFMVQLNTALCFVLVEVQLLGLCHFTRHPVVLFLEVGILLQLAFEVFFFALKSPH